MEVFENSKHRWDGWESGRCFILDRFGSDSNVNNKLTPLFNWLCVGLLLLVLLYIWLFKVKENGRGFVGENVLFSLERVSL